jgi:hypothetical protein
VSAAAGSWVRVAAVLVRLGLWSCLAICSLGLLVLAGCGGDDSGSSDNGAGKPSVEGFDNAAQAGPGGQATTGTTQTTTDSTQTASGSGQTGKASTKGKGASQYTTNTCRANVDSDVANVDLKSSAKYSHDDWLSGSGPRLLRGDSINEFGTESGFLRGCWFKLVWGDANGTIEVYAEDPFSGHNQYHCTTTGVYRCFGTIVYHPHAKEVLDGPDLKVNYTICKEGQDSRTCTGNGSPSRYP